MRLKTLQIKIRLGILLCFVSLAACHQSTLRPQQSWVPVTTTGEAEARHESALAAYKGKLYMIGGRKIKPVGIYDPKTNQWTQGAKPPIEIHHFQAVPMDDGIDIIGAFTGKFPYETAVEKVLVYLPEKDAFEFRHALPESRARGAAGAVRHGDWIYLVGGSTNGHWDGFTPWLDRYHSKTGKWESLPDAQHARDHFAAVIIDDVLYAVGGRTSSHKTQQVFDLTVKQGDAYDIQKQAWLPTDPALQIPTERAGTLAIGIKNFLVIGGGESGQQKVAHSEVEAFDTIKRSWQDWPALARGRHGTGFSLIGHTLYTCAGSGNRGGRPELVDLEALLLK